MNLYSFSVLNFSFGTLLIAILVLLKRKDAVAFRFFFFSMIVCGWGYLFSFMISQNYSEETTLFLSRLLYVFVVFIPISWLSFVFEFTKSKEPFRYFYLMNYMIAFACAFTCPTPLMFKGTHSILGFRYLPTPGIFHHIHLAQYIGLVSVGFYALIRTYQKSAEEPKKQLKHLILGTIIGFIAASSIYLAYYRISFPLYLFVLMPLYPILMGIGLIRYKLFDVQEIADAFQREKITALGIMAASLNHEMKNPLYVAKGRIEGYKHVLGNLRTFEEKEKKSEEIIESVERQLNRTLDIMQRFSDFSRPDILNKKEQVLISEIFQEVSELVSHEIMKRKIRVQTDFQEGLKVNIHRRQFEEILVNLMINASQAIPEAGGEIKVKAFQPNGKLHFEVSDNGQGISEENQKRLFDPFFSTKGSKGTGLGLYITKQLVERNGGKISVKSKAGKGTSFVLEFKV